MGRLLSWLLIPYSVSHTAVEEAKQDIFIAMQIFTQNTKNATVYFAWREGEEVVPEAYTKPAKSFNRMFLETQILFFVVFIVFGTFIFVAISVTLPDLFWVAPLVLIGIQFIFVFYSTRFIARSADWHITKENPIIHLLEYYLPINAKQDFNKSYPRETLIAIKKEIYTEIIAKHGEVDVESAQKVFLKHGVPCELQNLKAKKINVYEIVIPGAIEIVDRFHAKQHLSDLGKAVYGPADSRAAQWAKRRHAELDDGRFDALLQAISRQIPACDEARQCLHYFKTNRRRMRYPEFHERGLCTSTGVVEAGCKVAIGTRLKRAGMHWTLNGSNAIIALRCCRLSGRFQDFWERRSEARAA